jgi:phosphoserine phosphatase
MMSKIGVLCEMKEPIWRLLDKMENALRLVVLDCDGVLVDTRQILDLAKKVGAQQEVEFLMKQWREESGSPSPYHLKAVTMLRGLSHTDAKEVAQNLPLMPGAEEAVKTLKDHGLKIAIITNGYYITTGALKEKLGVDYVFANELLFEEGVATGKVLENISDADAKVHALREIIQVEGISLDQCAVVGDGINDYVMIKQAGLGIAFNADPMLRHVADVVIEERDLRAIVPEILKRVKS